VARPAAAAGTGWVSGRAPDLLWGCGLAYALAFAAHALGGPAFRAAFPPWSLALGVLALSGAHYGATLLRVYQRGEDRRRYAWAALWTSAALAALFVAGLHSPALGSWIIVLYLTWSPWHYSGQNYGVALLLLRRRGVEVSPALKRLLWASFGLSFGLTFLAYHGAIDSARYAPAPAAGELGGFAYPLHTLGIPDPAQDVALAALGGAYALVTGLVLARLLRAGARASAPALALLASQALWFAAPALARNWKLAQGVEPLSLEHAVYAFQWIALAHAVQYLWITAHYARRAGQARSALGFWGRALLAGSAIWTAPALLFAPAALGPLPYDAGLGLLVAAVVNLHHFVLDGAVWKLRDTRVSSILLGAPGRPAGRAGAGAAAGVPAPAPLAARGRLRLWPAFAALGAAGVLINAAAEYEVEFGLRDAAARRDAARYERAAQRLRWLGRDSAQLHFSAGNRALERGDLVAADREYRRGLDLHPTWESALMLGYARRRQGDHLGAREAFELAHRLAPHQPRTGYFLGATLLDLGETTRALELLERAALAEPANRGYRAKLAEARARSRQTTP
jgi:tetratricopeptide (TPR) repeat protein